MGRMPITAWMLTLATGSLGSQAEAQQRPLVTEDPETIGAGRLLVEGGFDYARAQFYPLSGLRGNLLRLPLFGISVGLSSIAEIQIDGGLHNRLKVTDRRPAPLSRMLDFQGSTTTSVEDLVIATKIRVVGESARRPALGVRVATRLPNASNESGLGLDTTDFFGTVLAGKTVRSIRVVGNLGIGILGDAMRGDRQNEVLTYGVSLARAMTTRIEFVGEIAGRAHVRGDHPSPGTESRGTMRLGARYTRGAGRVDAALLVGMTARDPSVGVAAGYTHVFNAFRIP